MLGMLHRKLLAALLISALATLAGEARTIESGIAFTDAEAMRQLERKGFSLGALLSPGWQRDAPSRTFDNAELARLPALLPLHEVIKDEFKAFESGYRARFPGEDPIVGFDSDRNHRLFDRSFLRRKSGRFELVGIVNRMDLAYKDERTCGEIRFIYRLAYTERLGASSLASRLPMSFNLVLHAKRPEATTTCAEIARRWLAVGDLDLKAAGLVRRLTDSLGPLALVEPSQIDRFETNIQVIRVPATIVPGWGGHAEYLLNVFQRRPDGSFVKARLENQIDRQALKKDAAKLAALKAWLFEPANLRALDQGTIKIPETYLASQAISTAPGGTARASNRPFAGLISADEAKAALVQLGGDLARMRNIKSPAGLKQRLTDITCSGCHQSRAIGGFHFMGADRVETIRAIPQNAIFVPASPHFYGDAPRRRAAVEAFAADRGREWGRDFSLRPHTGLDDTEIRNGWGSHCAIDGRDPSFAGWKCRGGVLHCSVLHASREEPGLGTCVTKATSASSLRIGDAFQTGRIVSKPTDHYFRDSYVIENDLSGGRGTARQGGGFFGGMHKVRGCDRSRREGICAREAGDAFNACVAASKGRFKECLEKNTQESTLRVCDLNRPCRDDYVCLATKETLTTGRGACLPPYFLFQFRVDGHPLEQ